MYHDESLRNWNGFVDLSHILFVLTSALVNETIVVVLVVAVIVAEVGEFGVTMFCIWLECWFWFWISFEVIGS